MNDEELIIVFEDQKTSIYPTLVSSIMSIIAMAVIVWMLFEAIRLVQTGDYSLFLILLVIVSGAAIVAYSVLMSDDEEEKN